MRHLILAIFLLMAPGVALADTKAEIDAANRAFVAAFGKGDGAGVAALYTTKATLLPPGQPAMSGRAAIEAFWAGAIKAGLKNVSLEAQSVESVGRGTVREIGKFGYDVPNGPRAEGKYVVIWKKVGKNWRLDVDIWNMDK